MGTQSRDDNGRWIVPQASGLPSLVIINPRDRAAICGYPATRDCLRSLTAIELLAFAEVAWVDGWEHEPVLRRWIFRGIALYGIYGWPESVTARIRGLVRSQGGNVRDIEIPNSHENKQIFFIVGAKLAAECVADDLYGKEIA